MSTYPQEFIDLAHELIGKEFAPFAKPCIFTNATGWDNTSQTATTETQTVQAIRTSFQRGKFNGQAVMVGDIKLILQNQLLTIPVFPDSTKCEFDGEHYSIVDISLDAASAVLEIQARRK